MAVHVIYLNIFGMNHKMKIRVATNCPEDMNAHAEATFPEECCGAMLGIEHDDGTREITKIIRVDNTKGENRERRFLIDPRALLNAEKVAKEHGLEHLGIYHSHPNHPSQASEFDRVHAMPFWSYLIISCMDGKAARVQSWRLREDRSAFDEEELIPTH